MAKEQRTIVAYRIDREVLQAMQTLWDRDGVTPSEQVRRALRAYLEERNVLEKLGPPARKQTRRKA